MKDKEQARIHEAWPELAEADRERNFGSSMELFSAEMYARREGGTVAQYIIGVLRAERDRRQAVDSITTNAIFLDGLIENARIEGMSVLEWVIREIDMDDVASLGKDFLIKLVRRLEDRLTAVEGRQPALDERLAP